MKKISRRDYMLQMGAGALGVMGTARMDIMAESRRNQTTALLWDTTESLPSNPRITAIFGGLFGFFYNTNTHNCEIGDHKGGGRHRLTIDVWELRNSRCIKHLFSTENGTLPNPKDPKIEIAGRSPGAAKFYEVGAYNRATLRPKDFRWLPDLDSDDFYPTNRPKLTGQFKNKIVVRHGTFYTQQRTNSTFDRIDPPESQTPNTLPFYQVANYMAAGIEPNQNEDVVFRINDNSAIVFKDKPGYTYQIVILNHCYQDGHHLCEFDPGNANETNRNDFHFMRKMVQLSGDDRVYGLKVKERNYSQPNFCMEDAKRGSDESPCMGTAFGKTDGMP